MCGLCVYHKCAMVEVSQAYEGQKTTQVSAFMFSFAWGGVSFLLFLEYFY